MNFDSEKYHLLIENLPDAFAYHQIVTDDDGTPVDYIFLEINDAFVEMTGLKREKVIGKKVTEILPGIEKSEFDWIGTYGKVAQGGEAIRFDSFSEPLGRWYDINAYSDEPGCFIAVFRDITKYQEIQEKHKNQRDLLQRYLDTTDTIMVTLDRTGNITMVNRYGLELLEYAEDQLIGKNWFEVVLPQPEGMKKVYPVYLQIMSGNLENVSSFENGILTATGSHRTIAWHNNYLLNNKGDIVGTLSSGMDITERKKIEEALRESELILKDILESTLSGFWDWNLVDNTEYLSPTFKRMFGYEDYEMESSPEAWQRIIFPEDLPGVFEDFDRHVKSRGREPFYNEIRYRHKDGSTVWVICTGRVIEWAEDGTALRMIGCHIDITERKQMEEALQASEKQLVAKNKELEQIVYVASHDLRSPLVNVDGFSRELEYSLKDIYSQFAGSKTDYVQLENTFQTESANMETALQRIKTSTRQMDLLLKGLLKISRLGRAALQIGPIDMNELCRQISSTFDYRIKENGIELTIGELPSCRGDAQQLTQVFTNLFDNAIKYLDPDRPGIIQVSGAVDANRCLYYIEDNGIGIAEKHQGIIFELFHRLNPGEGEGEGLGLTIARQIIGRLDGEVTVESQLGAGSIFIVSLPSAAERIS